MLPSWSGPEVFISLANLVEQFYAAIYQDVFDFCSTFAVPLQQQNTGLKKQIWATSTALKFSNDIDNDNNDDDDVLPIYQSSIELSASALRALFDIVICDKMRYWILQFKIPLNLTAFTTCDGN